MLVAWMTKLGVSLVMSLIPLPRAGIPIEKDHGCVQVLKVGYGACQTSDEPIRQWWRRHLPSRVASFLGPVYSLDVKDDKGFNEDASKLVVVLQFTDDLDRPREGLPRGGVRLTVVDSQGFEYRQAILEYHAHNMGVKTVRFDSFPRREPTLRLRLRNSKTGAWLKDIVVANPGYRPVVKEWQPEKLPATRELGGARVTLKSVNLDFENQTTTEKVDLDDPRKRWQVLGTFYDDASGNSEMWLSPFEPVWKARVWMAEVGEGVDEQTISWKIGPLKLADRLQTVKVDQTRDVNGLRIHVTPGQAPMPRPEKLNDEMIKETVGKAVVAGVVGAAFGGLDHVGGLSVSDHSPQVRIEWSPPDPDAQVSVEFKDEKGRDVDSSVRESGEALQLVAYQPRPGAKSVTMTVSVIRYRWIEFFLTPPAELRERVRFKAAEFQQQAHPRPAK